MSPAQPLPPRLVDLVRMFRQRLTGLVADLKGFTPSQQELLPVSALSLRIGKAEVDEAAAWLDGLDCSPLARRLLEHWKTYAARGGDFLVAGASQETGEAEQKVLQNVPVPNDLPSAGANDSFSALEYQLSMFVGATQQFADFCGELEELLKDLNPLPLPADVQPTVNGDQTEDCNPPADVAAKGRDRGNALIDEAEIDDIEECLSGQQLAIYKFLWGRKHWTNFRTLADQDSFWNTSDPSDETIVRALRRLRNDLNTIGAGVALTISSKDRRTKLEGLGQTKAKPDK